MNYKYDTNKNNRKKLEFNNVEMGVDFTCLLITRSRIWNTRVISFSRPTEKLLLFSPHGSLATTCSIDFTVLVFCNIKNKSKTFFREGLVSAL